MADKSSARSELANITEKIWLVIFGYLDQKTLLTLTLVCNDWNKLIFSRMAGRFVLLFDVDQHKFPQKEIGMVPDRHYQHLCVKSFRLDSLAYLLTVVKQLAGSLVSLKLHLQLLDCEHLNVLLPLFKRLNELDIKATYLENAEIVYQNPEVPTIESLKLDIANRVSVYKPANLERVLLPCIPNVQKLTMFIRDPQDIDIINFFAPQLKVFKASVDCKKLNLFLTVRLHALTSLDLTVDDMGQGRYYQPAFRRTTFQPLLLEGKHLRRIALKYCRFYKDEEPLGMIFDNFPKLETLEFCGYGTRCDVLCLDGIEKMKQLKYIALQYCLVRSLLPIVPSPSVENLNLTDALCDTRSTLINILQRFSNLKYLTVSYGEGEAQVISKHAPQLKHLTVKCRNFVKPDLLNDIKLMVGLRTLTIETAGCSKGNFRLLEQIIILPELRTLTVNILSFHSVSGIARPVATANPTCRLILNNELVKPYVARLASKRKRSKPSNSHATTKG